MPEKTRGQQALPCSVNVGEDHKAFLSFGTKLYSGTMQALQCGMMPDKSFGKVYAQIAEHFG
jgi:hypothetical protein